MKKLKIEFLHKRFLFAIKLGKGYKYLIICWGICIEADYLFRDKPDKRLVLYLPIPQILSEGEEIKYRFILKTYEYQ